MHARVQVEVRVYRISEVCKPPAPSRHRSPTRSQPVRGQRNSRISVYRWSKIGRVSRPRQYACKDRGGRNPEVRYQPAPSRHRSRLLSQTVRRLAQAPPTPFIDGRKPPSTAHANMHTSIGVTGYPRSGKLPAPLCHRSPTPIQAVRGGRLTLAAASRCSKICPIDRPRQHVCKHRCDRIPKVRQTARAVVPSLSGTLADCARRRGRSPDTKDSAIKKCSARLLTDSQGRLPAKVEYALCANTSLLACVYTIAVGCPSFTLCQELNTDGRFERSMVEHRSHLPSPRAERCAFVWMVRRLFLAMQLRKVSGERNTVPERIPRSVSGSRT